MSNIAVPKGQTGGKPRAALIKTLCDERTTGGDPIVHDFGKYENSAGRQDVFGLSGCPAFGGDSLEVFAAAGMQVRSFYDAIAFCLALSLPELEKLKAYRSLCWRRATILRVAPQLLVRYNMYSYDAIGNGGPRHYPRIIESDHSKCFCIATALGLRVPPKTAGIRASIPALIAICLIRHDVRCIHPQHRASMRHEIDCYIDMVEERDTEIRRIYGEVLESPTSEPYDVTSADLLRGR